MQRDAQSAKRLQPTVYHCFILQPPLKFQSLQHHTAHLIPVQKA